MQFKFIIVFIFISGVLVGQSFFLKHMGLCKFIATVCMLCCAVSLLSICIVSLNRYCYIVKNSRYNIFFSKRKCSILCFLIWVVSIGSPLPNHLGWSDQVFDVKTLSCIFDRVKHPSFVFFLAGFLVFTPIIVTAVCYVLIFYQWHQSAKKISNLSKSSSNKSMQLVRVLFLIFFTFVICWAPYAIILLVDYRDNFSVLVHSVIVIIAHFNSSLNPLIYGFTNTQFRAAYLKILGIKYLCAKFGKTKIMNVSENSENICI